MIDIDEVVTQWLDECTDGRCHKDTVSILASYTRWLVSKFGDLSEPEHSERQDPDAITVLKNELEALRAANTWLPIKDAPRDGSNILVWSSKPKLEGVYIVSWGVSEPFGVDPGWVTASEGPGYSSEIECITHYRPLPPPPGDGQ
jgi:hypothetical protein